MIFTNVGKMGDFILTWPVASWYYRVYNEKIHFVLSDNFAPFKKLESLLRYQDFTENVTYVDVGTDNHIPSHWKFNPEVFGIDGQYYNFGFPREPDEYVPKFYAGLHKIGCDMDFVVKCPIDNKYENDTLWIMPSSYRDDYKTFKAIIKPEYIEIDTTLDVMQNCAYALGAKEIYSNMGGFAALMDLCNKKINIFELTYVLLLKNHYYRNNHTYIINPKMSFE